ncbi:ketoacyl-ACP synthase III family protein [Pendulispora brunnea]|uniref:Ketoacyl-ACP synthase III family protein n=1 Tax=Pendulispora brunnea TaxID=2905690 RepID=A0ABZ2KLG7_9BACT
MKIERLFIAGIGTYLPPLTRVEDAVADGRYDPQEAEDTGLESVCEATTETPPDMAVTAARSALARSGIRPEDVSLILHASLYFQGLELYTTASYIHREALGTHSALALEVKNQCNGSMTSMELAACYLQSSPERSAALVTTADKCCLPVIDRWKCDIGTVPSDGATAMILSQRGGFARVLSTVTVSDPSLERLHRGNAPFTTFNDPKVPVDLRLRKLQYLGDVELDEFTRKFRTGLRNSVDQALRDAGITFRDVARFVIPHAGRLVLQREYFMALDIAESATTWAWGRKLGHIGAGDQVAGFGHLVETNALKPGDHCLLMGVGAGFTWTCAVVQLIEQPSWARGSTNGAP